MAAQTSRRSCPVSSACSWSTAMQNFTPSPRRNSPSSPSPSPWISKARAGETAPTSPPTASSTWTATQLPPTATGSNSRSPASRTPSSVGAQIEMKAGTVYRKQTYEGVPLVFRLGARTQVDTVRITWPNGLIQNETEAAGQPRRPRIKEAQRLSGSCPMIFTWNGERLPVHHRRARRRAARRQFGRRQYFPVDHDEYVQIPGEALAAARRRLRNPHHRRAARGVLPRPDPADRASIIRRTSRSSPTTNSSRRRFPSSACSASSGASIPSRRATTRRATCAPRSAQRDRVYPDAFRRDYDGRRRAAHARPRFRQRRAAAIAPC